MTIKKEQGFTIVELLVSVLLTSIIMLAIYSVYRVQTHSTKVQENRLEAQEYARSVLDMMVREIRNAGYNPLSTTTGTYCGGTGNPTAAPSIVVANATTIQFAYDFQGGTPSTNPDGHCDDDDEEITFQYQSPGPQNCATGLGDITRTARRAGSSSLTTESLTDCNVTSFSLTYYPQDCTTAFVNPVGAGTATCSASNNGTLAAIQRVSISITVRSKNPDTEFGGQLTVTMTSNADLRNRGLPS